MPVPLPRKSAGTTRSRDGRGGAPLNGSERTDAFRSDFGEIGGRFGGIPTPVAAREEQGNDSNGEA
jgi:hypothetical protein